MNRTMFRGVCGGVLGAVIAATAGFVGPTIAVGAEPGPEYGRPIPLAQQRAAMRWRLPKVGYLRHVHPSRARPSRAAYRTSLSGSPQTVAHALLLRHGWGEGEWRCLDTLWTRESGWSTTATNDTSGAYGIPQALPATKMATAGADWRTNPVTQIRWGLSYIATTYETPCAALSHSSSTGYY